MAASTLFQHIVSQAIGNHRPLRVYAMPFYVPLMW